MNDAKIYLQNRTMPNEEAVEDVWRLISTFNMIIADNKDIVHLIL